LSRGATARMAEEGSEDAVTRETFDAVVVGTGFAESVLSAALARIGKRVLHVDAHDFYGGACCTFSLLQLASTLAAAAAPPLPTTAPLQALLRLRREGWTGVRDAEVVVGAGDALRRVVGGGRRHGADLTPALLLSAGPTVALLVRSGVSRYLEFRAVDACLVFRGGVAHAVPNSRAALFSDATLGLAEKRQLMRFLHSVATPQDSQATAAAAAAAAAGLPQAPERSTLLETMRGEPYRLQPGGRVEELVAHCIALAPSRQAAMQMTAADGKRRIAVYAESVGRYGNTATPFLATQYGTSELAQAFCRESAVYGTTFILRCAASHVVSSESAADRMLAVALSGGPFTESDRGFAHTRWVVCSAGLVAQLSSVPTTAATPGITERHRQRCIVATDKPIFANRPGNVFVVVPPGERSNADSTVFVTQYDSTLGVAPEGNCAYTHSLLPLCCMVW